VTHAIPEHGNDSTTREEGGCAKSLESMLSPTQNHTLQSEYAFMFHVEHTMAT